MATVMAMDDALTVTGGREGQRDRGTEGQREWEACVAAYSEQFFVPIFASFRRVFSLSSRRRGCTATLASDHSWSSAS